MDWLQALVLGLVQGLTEFLPISSSAHLSIIGQLYGGVDPGSAFTAINQLGTEAAVIIYFRKDIWLIIRHWCLALVGRIPRDDPQARMGWLVIIGSVPIVILGVLFQDEIDYALRNLWITTAMLAGVGVIIGVVDHFARNVRPLEQLTWGHGIAVRAGPVAGPHPRGVPLGSHDHGRTGARLQAGGGGEVRLPARDSGRRRIGFLQTVRRLRGSGRAGLGADHPGHRGRLLRRSGGDPLAAALHQHPQLLAVRDLPDRAGGRRGRTAADRGAGAAADG